MKTSKATQKKYTFTSSLGEDIVFYRDPEIGAWHSDAFVEKLGHLLLTIRCEVANCEKIWPLSSFTLLEIITNRKTKESSTGHVKTNDGIIRLLKRSEIKDVVALLSTSAKSDVDSFFLGVIGILRTGVIRDVPKREGLRDELSAISTGAFKLAERIDSLVNRYGRFYDLPASLKSLPGLIEESSGKSSCTEGDDSKVTYQHGSVDELSVAAVLKTLASEAKDKDATIYKNPFVPAYKESYVTRNTLMKELNALLMKYLDKPHHKENAILTTVLLGLPAHKPVTAEQVASYLWNNPCKKS